MTQSLIPLNRVVLENKAGEYIREALAHGHLGGNGPFTQRAEAMLTETLGAPKIFLTSSCTHALEAASLLLEIDKGDEVILPSFTFVSTANAFILRGAVPIFADIKPTTLNLDETQLERLITPRTRAIVVVHYAGVGCEMESILNTARRHKIAVIEDNAHGLFGKYRGKYLGTFGCLAAQSFHETKSYTCGEGGALIVNDRQYLERAEVILEKGTNRRQFFRGEVDHYSWVDIGSSYLASDVLAAILCAQLESREKIEKTRRRLWEYYETHLRDWADRQGARLPLVPPECEPSHALFYLVLPSLEARQALIAHLQKRRITAAFHYPPLHLSEMGKRFKGRVGLCPVTERTSDGLVRLPFYDRLSEEEQNRVVKAVLKFNRSPRWHSEPVKESATRFYRE